VLRIIDRTVVLLIAAALIWVSYYIYQLYQYDTYSDVDSPHVFDTTLEQYRNIGGHYPSTEQGLEALFKKPTTPPHPRRWKQSLLEVPRDPWKTPYKYQYSGSKDLRLPEIISAGPDREFGTEDDQSNQDR
jgi:general secretion pathway protein G